MKLRMQSRYLLAILLAASITVALFLAMRYLIIGQDGELSEPPKGKVIDFVRLKQDETVETKKRMPKKPPKPEDPPPDMSAPQPQQDLAMDSAGLSFQADFTTDTSLQGGLALESGDGEYLPIVKVAPIYPRRALSRGIEGFVIVEFTVTRNGSVRDPFVVEAEPENIFDKAALDAALKFKYKPRVIDGQATEVAGVQNKITFTMRN